MAEKKVKTDLATFCTYTKAYYLLLLSTFTG